VTEVTVSLSTRDGGIREIKLQMSEETYQQLEAIGRARRKNVGDVIIEALRVEQLLADGKLLVRSGRDIKDLVAV